MTPLSPPNCSTSNNDSPNHDSNDDNLRNNVIVGWAKHSSGDEISKSFVTVGHDDEAITTTTLTVADAMGATNSDYDEHNQDDEEEGDLDTSSWGPLPWLESMSGTTRDQLHTLSTATASVDYYFNDNPMDEDFDCQYTEDNDDDSTFFGFARSNYMESIRTWTCSGGGNSDSPKATISDAAPQRQPLTVTARAQSSSSSSSLLLLPMATDTNSVDADDDDDDFQEDKEDDDDECPPGMVRSTSDSLSSEETTDEDETMSNSSSSDSSSSDDDDDVDDSSAISEDDDTSHTHSPPPPRGVTFNEQVRVLPIPPIEHYTPEQRYKMYANRFELRENKLRNKREFEFDNYDWRNATEEHCMAICPMSGELLHPAHF